jgi:ubiquinol-cytochrome c reductase cytochrome c subunit
MMVRTLVAAAAALAVCVGAVSAPAQDADRAPAGDAARGKVLFHADACWECHGTVGQGGGAAGPRIGPMELPWSAFLMQLRSPQNNMPPFEAKVLATGDAANIYAYLKTIPKPPDAASIAILH